ncbi:MAG: hypothetical protein PHP65_01915 [Bacilli bacterium]|jgi:hypothetical protein|nr:hypothetical protein [Bacilli bacterium]
MDHVVYLDYKADELNKLLDGLKKMIIRGATGRKLPYGRVFEGDVLYFTQNNAEGLIVAKAKAKRVLNSEKMTDEESISLVNKNQMMLALTDTQYKKWAGKRYIVLIELEEVIPVEPFKIDKSNFGNMDDWLPVIDINIVKLP